MILGGAAAAADDDDDDDEDDCDCFCDRGRVQNLHCRYGTYGTNLYYTDIPVLQESLHCRYGMT